MSDVIKDAGLFSVHDEEIAKDKTTTINPNGSTTTEAKDITGSAGFDGIRPGVSLSATKVEETVDPGGASTIATSSVTAQAAIGAPASVSGYKVWERNKPQPNGDVLKTQVGVGGSFSYGSTPEVAAGFRGDLVRDGGNGLSPYFKMVASGGAGTPPSVRLEGGACKNVDLGTFGKHQLCGGVGKDSNGRMTGKLSSGYNF